MDHQQLANQHVQQTVVPVKVCSSCGKSETPQWREGPEGMCRLDCCKSDQSQRQGCWSKRCFYPAGKKTLCNACGVKLGRMKKQAAEAAQGKIPHRIKSLEVRVKAPKISKRAPVVKPVRSIWPYQAVTSLSLNGGS